MKKKQINSNFKYLISKTDNSRSSMFLTYNKIPIDSFSDATYLGKPWENQILFG